MAENVKGSNRTQDKADDDGSVEASGYCRFTMTLWCDPGDPDEMRLIHMMQSLHGRRRVNWVRSVLLRHLMNRGESCQDGGNK